MYDSYMQDREFLTQLLEEYFGINNPRGSYHYNLVRDKRAFEIGTMTTSDFVEYGESDISEIVEYIIDGVKEGRNEL